MQDSQKSTAKKQKFQSETFFTNNNQNLLFLQFKFKYLQQQIANWVSYTVQFPIILKDKRGFFLLSPQK